MSPAEIQALVAAAAPGTRVTVLVFDIPEQLGRVVVPAVGTLVSGDAAPPSAARSWAPSPPSASADMPKPWTPKGGAELAHALAARQTPFTCAELAQVLQVKPETVSHWCRTGVLQDVPKIPGAGWRIPPSNVIAMLAASTPPGADRSGVADAAAGTSAQVERDPGAQVAGASPDVSTSVGAAAPSRAGSAGGTAAAVPTPSRHDLGAPTAHEGNGSHGGKPAEVIGGFDLAGLGSWRQRRQGGRS